MANSSVHDLQWHFALFCFCLSYHTYANTILDGYWFYPTPFIYYSNSINNQYHNMQVPAISNGSAIFLWFFVDLISVSVFSVTDFF